LRSDLLHRLLPEVRAAITQEWERLELENKLLKEAIRLMRIEKYGPKSEQLSDQQLALLESEPGVAAEEIQSEAQRTSAEKEELEAEPQPPRSRQHPGRTPLPAHLPRIEEIVACPSEQCRCTQCGAEKKVFGYDLSEELDVKPAEYFVRVIKREKRACSHCEELGVSMAPLPAKIVEKGKASNRVVTDVIIKKYCDHLPLYRQSAILQREAGIDLNRMTLCGWVQQGGQWLGAISGALRAELLAGDYIQADETTVAVQTRESTGSNHQGYLWQYSRPGGPVVFDFQMGRSREGPRKFLAEFNGILQCDGYEAYDKIGGEGLIFAGCMAHARRGFVEALKVMSGHKAARQIVRQFGQLYAVEKEAREGKLSHGDRLALRRSRSVPVLAELKENILKVRANELLGSVVGKACNYALNQWERLSVYASHGEVEIDNNWCENAMRPTVIGRKNWLHIGSENAGPRIAAISSVIETCRRLDVNARDYLTDVLPKIPGWPAKRIAELTPASWAKQRPA
jgi:transposase